MESNLHFENSTKDMLKISRDIAVSIGNKYIQPEHFFLALLQMSKNPIPGSFEYFNHVISGYYEIEPVIIDYLKKTEQKDHKDENITLSKTAERLLKISYLEAKYLKSKSITEVNLFMALLKDNTIFITNELEKKYGLTYGGFIERIEKHHKEYEKYLSKIIQIKDIHNSSSPLNLYFNLDEYNKEEIVEMLTLLSEMYTNLGGDELIINGATTLEFCKSLEPEIA